MNLGDVFLRLLADDKGFEKSVVKSGEKAGDKAGKTLGSRLKEALSPKNLAVAGFAAAAGGLTLFAAGIGQAVKDLIRIEQIGAQTDAVIKSTGGSANVTREQVDGMAQSIEKLSGIEAESVTEGQNLLLTFTNIRNEAGEGNAIFDRATEAMVDYGVAMGTDAKGGAIQLGKALNDPIKGITALGRAGVQFTEDQKEMIKGFVEAGDLLSAQKIILEELETQFGGSAEAFGNTTAGRIAKFQNEIGDMFESIVLGALKVSEAMGGAAEPVGDFFNNMGLQFGPQSKLVEEAADRVGVSVEDMRDRIGRAMDEQNLSFEEATQVASNEFTELRAEAFYTYAEVSRMAAEGLAATGETVEREFKRIAKMPGAIMRAEYADIREAAYQSQVEYAKGLLDAQNEPKVAMDALVQYQEETLSNAAQVAYLQGLLNSKELAAGLIDSRPLVNAQARATRDAIINQLKNLGAWSWGFETGTSYADGMNAAYGYVRDAAGNLAAATRGQIGINSEPEAYDSPLRGITKWGGNIVRTLADGILGELGVGRSAGMALAGALAPGFGGAMPLAGGAAGGVGGGNTYQLVVGGVERTFNSRTDFMNALDDLARHGEGGLDG